MELYIPFTFGSRIVTLCLVFPLPFVILFFLSLFIITFMLMKNDNYELMLVFTFLRNVENIWKNWFSCSSFPDIVTFLMITLTKSASSKAPLSGSRISSALCCGESFSSTSLCFNTKFVSISSQKLFSSLFFFCKLFLGIKLYLLQKNFCSLFWGLEVLQRPKSSECFFPAILQFLPHFLCIQVLFKLN